MKSTFINSNPHLHKEKEMVEFRKAFLLLAALVALTGIVSAQVTPLSCTANAGVPPLARAEGVAEEVGQVIINCVGGQPTTLGAAIPTINVQIFLNTTVTSRLLSSTSGTINSEALLMIDEPLPGAQFLASSIPNTTVVTGMGNGDYAASATRPNLFLGQQQGSNSIVWLNIPFDPPGTTRNRVLRIANVRANANQLGVSTTLIPTAINMFISISGTGSLALTNPQLTVAYVQLGLKFSASSATWNQCVPGTYSYNIKFAENFGTAFRHKDSGSVMQDIPGRIYNTESMFYGPALGSYSAIAGLATQGTQLIARFSNVPANISISVPVYTATAPAVSSGSDYAVTITNGASGSTTGTDGVVALTGGAGAAVFEVIASNPGAISTFTIPVSVTYKASPLPGLGTATVTGNYAPTTTVTTASYSAPVPRFVDNPQSATTFTISSCRTNLLFPFLTNVAGFDSGVVISNTSMDPFGTVTQSGPCTLNYYGTTGGTGAAPAAQTSGTVAAGSQLVLTLSAGGNLGVVATPGFQGYVIATCNFQYAHGYAFISDLGASRVAEGYLALVMDAQMSTFPRTGTVSEVLGM
ncbi:MAG: hypothetical protein HY821_17325 [Acidobacteria bacterium]|nr:hypothetical protein [Acidobacteriota bacterium]